MSKEMRAEATLKINQAFENRYITRPMSLDWLESISSGKRTVVIVRAEIALVETQDPDIVRLIGRVRRFERDTYQSPIDRVYWKARMYVAAAVIPLRDIESDGGLFFKALNHLQEEVDRCCRALPSVLGIHQEGEKARTYEDWRTLEF